MTLIAQRTITGAGVRPNVSLDRPLSPQLPLGNDSDCVRQHLSPARYAVAILRVSRQERDVYFNGRKDENGKTIDQGLIGCGAYERAGLSFLALGRMPPPFNHRRRLSCV
jgi:hypothetical protein